MKRLLFYVLLFLIVVGTVYWYGMEFYAARQDLVWEKDSPSSLQSIVPVTVPAVERPPEKTADAVEIRTVQVSDVPFAVQAPDGKWSNPIYQDACEEASITMAAYHLMGKPLSAATAKAEILELANYGEKTFGHYVDTSASDTAKMLKDHYQIDSAVISEPAKDDIKRALAQGALVLVPADGRKLKNPNFTPPGPINHMLVITGYDMEARKFVTNDPGTRAGREYRYDEDVLYAAIRDYPTGNHLPNPNPKKAMIVVPLPEKESPEES